MNTIWAMLLLYAALKWEGEALIDRFALRRDLRMAACRLFSNRSLQLLCGGVGPLRTANALRSFAGELSILDLPPPAAVLNIGICAAQPALDLGSLYWAATVDAEDAAAIPLWTPPGGAALRLRSFCHPQTVPMPECDLADMEGFTCAQTALRLFPGCRVGALKIAADHFEPRRLTRAVIKALFSPHLDHIAAAVDIFRDAETAVLPQ